MDDDKNIFQQDYGAVNLTDERPYVAVASQEGLFINLHLGESEFLRIYKPNSRYPELVDMRTVPGSEIKGTVRWKELAGILKDCSCLLVNGIGQAPRSILMNAGISVYVVEGFVEKAVMSIGTGKGVRSMIMEEHGRYGSACGGE